MSSAIVHTDMEPSPRVDVTIDPGDVTGDQIVLWRLTAMGQRPVRGAEMVDAAGGLFVTDYEVPFRGPVVYRVQEFVGGVEAGWGLELPVSITAEGTVISDPQVPESAVAVQAEASFAGSMKRSRQVQRVVAGGRTVALMGRLGLYESVPLKCWTDSFEASQQLRDLLVGGIVLVRTSIPSLPAEFYCVVADVPEIPHNYRAGGQILVWELVADEVSPNTLPILKATVTWDRVVAAFATWDDLKAARSTWQDIRRNPPPET